MNPTWREKAKLELRDEIYRTALRLFGNDGYEATKVADITDQLGIAKGTFFNHFPSKEHVIACWYDAITRKTLIRAQRRQSAGCAAAIADLFADMAQEATRVPELLIAKFRYCTDPALMDVEKTQAQAIHALIQAHCEQAVSTGELPRDLDIHQFGDVLVAVLTGTARSWVYTDPRFDFPATIGSRVQFLFQLVGVSNAHN